MRGGRVQDAVDVRQAIAMTMADGRERTALDIANATGFHPDRVRRNIHWFVERNMLTRQRLYPASIHAYRKVTP